MEDFNVSNEKINLFIKDELPNVLSDEEFLKYYNLFKNGDLDAKDKLIKHNMRLVSDRIYGRFKNVEYEKKDLFSIGLIGLIKAVNKFDIQKGYAFSTYAVSCIDNEILILIRKLQKYEPTDSIYDEIHCDNDGNDLTILDTLEDIDSDFTKYVENKELIIQIEKLMNDFNDRDSDIIKMYFGFYNNRCYTQQEIADKYNVSVSNISRLIKNNLKKLKEQLDENKKIEESTNKKNKIIKSSSKTIYEYFNDYKKEDVDKALAMLPEDYKQIIELKFGEDLDNPLIGVELFGGEVSKFYRVISKIRKYLEKPSDKSILSNKHKIKSFYELVGDYSKEDIDLIVNNLSDYDMEIIRKRYGNDLENTIASDEWDREYEEVFFKELVPRIRRRLKEK